MQPREHLAIVGSGPSAIYLLKHLLEECDTLVERVGEISIFEKSEVAGIGMPYSPLTTDRFNLSNISSEELPDLTESFADWLRAQPGKVLEEIGLGDEVEIDDGEIYCRIALGRYFNAQYKALVARLTERGLAIHEYALLGIVDVVDLPDEGRVGLVTERGDTREFDRVVIATGHCWTEKDSPESGYFASPWPISKLLPGKAKFLNFPVGTLGASLSAFDVLTSLAHRHGKFTKADGRLRYKPSAGADGFRIAMHSSHGLLPHLQYDQAEPFREIFRHIGRDGLLTLVDGRGFLRLERYFDGVCRPVLRAAFQKDGMPEMAARLEDAGFGIEDFVKCMTRKHDYENAFEGMRGEMSEARTSVKLHRPIHWKEVTDDLIYTLNYHAELMPAEDHIVLQKTVMPFLMNVIAAMPLPSGETILALYDAGRLDMVSGMASVAEKGDGETTIAVVDEDGKESSIRYRMFVDCSGQKPLELDEYPFPTLPREGTVRKARAPFLGEPDVGDGRVFEEEGEKFYQTGGVDIDGAFRVIGRDGQANPRIHDIAFPHTSGVRPYSYGLQACSDTAAVLVRAWAEEIRTGRNGAEDITRVYEVVSDPA